MKTKILLILLFLSLTTYSQHQKVKILSYYENGLFLDIKNNNSIDKFFVLEMNHSFKMNKSKYINIEGEMLNLIKVFRIRKIYDFNNNYLLEYYESNSGKRIVYLIQIPNHIKFKK